MYNMLECARLGHEIVALANLHPEDEEREELDSFTFQTVGHSVIPAYAQCMDLPLIRIPTKAVSVNQELQYEPAPEDEVEDLFELLKTVQEQIPHVQAVCSGAILSNYQRTRVECVCGRLGLISLAYMWQRSQTELLTAMAEAGLDTILIKVASMGLKPSHLGRTVAELSPMFQQLQSRFGFHPCGEGGEYESLCLDSPLFKQRIVIDNSTCLLYTSDAADEEDSVDLGGRRIIKKKKKEK
eukprot:TRINITY_DN24425_c0_g3_i1.p1 TRINITY_DN24425_c0_g3~~TRINITY_DN24425_c0_g3_i1.p1  ORF type:complete len:241 (+),score=40.88 TRINITY_DN24425_c0_g3_i1:60-782(+)